MQGNGGQASSGWSGVGCDALSRATIATSARSNSGTSSRMIVEPRRISVAKANTVLSATLSPLRLTNRYLPVIGLIHDSLARSLVPLSGLLNSTQVPTFIALAWLI